jgi:hypothetical protein
VSKTIIIAILSGFVFGCAGHAPVMERPIKVYNGAPEVGEHGAICRMNNKQLAEKVRAAAGSTLTHDFAEAIVSTLLDSSAEECIDGKDARMKQMGCMSWDDHAVLQRYIENLNFKCEKWKE